jgi:hypothetical protein
MQTLLSTEVSKNKSEGANMNNKKFAIVIGALVVVCALVLGLFLYLRPALKFIGFI